MKVFIRIGLVVFISAAIIVGGAVFWFYSGWGLPRVESLPRYNPAQNSKVFAADGTLLTEVHGDQSREIVSLEKIPKHMQQAVIAIEDKDYYEHSGVNWKRVVGALWANVVKGEVVQGGSTLTQQYIKNAYVGAERTLWRKIQEASLAYQMSKKYSKDKILEMYLNDIFFGHQCYGIFTAARRYFGKSPEHLTLPESALLAALINGPSEYDPYTQPQKATARRNLVLKMMVGQGYIKKADADAAMATPLNLQPLNRVYNPPPSPYFCDYIKKKLANSPDYFKESKSTKEREQKLYRGGLRIYTTIDLNLQHLAEETLIECLPDPGPDAALVCIDPRNGYIKAMVGGRDYMRNQFNSAADGGRQPGSSFKTFVLARAMADGVSPQETYDASSPRIIQLPDGAKWTVKNYDGKGSGSTTIEAATIRSINCVYAQMIMDIGPARVSKMAEDMGIMRDVEDNPAIALGGLSNGVTPLEMASAYATLANNGVHATPRSIYKITDAEGNVIMENKPETTNVLDPRVAAKINGILQKVVSGGTGTGAQIGRPEAGKTGTTEDNADAWFVGYTPDLVTAVWVGFPQGRIPMPGMTGGALPATIWREFMSRAFAMYNIPPTPFSVTGEPVQASDPDEPQPGEKIKVTVCRESSLLATPYCPSPVEKEFRRGEEPTTFCNLHRGSSTRPVPNVVGSQSSSAAASLEQAGFSVSTVQQESSAAVPGTVIAQSPAAGTPLAPGSAVTITVASGMPSVPVPNVIGLSEGEAKTTLAASGFAASVSYSPGSPVDTVIRQSPGGGTRLPPGSSVTIVVAKTPGAGLGPWWKSP